MLLKRLWMFLKGYEATTCIRCKLCGAEFETDEVRRLVFHMQMSHEVTVTEIDECLKELETDVEVEE